MIGASLRFFQDRALACESSSSELQTDKAVAAVQAYGKALKGELVAAMEREAFGACTNFRSCEAVCPKEISISGIARMNKDFRRAVMTGAATAPNGKKR